MEQPSANDNGKKWRLSGPDEDGSVWFTWTGEGPPLRLNLGADEEVATDLADWLAERDFGE